MGGIILKVVYKRGSILHVISFQRLKQDHLLGILMAILISLEGYGCSLLYQVVVIEQILVGICIGYPQSVDALWI